MGICILDLGKTFIITTFEKKYNDKGKLLIETEDVYKDFWSDKDKFDNEQPSVQLWILHCKGILALVLKFL